MKTVILKLCLSLFALVFALGAAEVGFRLLYPNDGPAAGPISSLQRALRDGSASKYHPHPSLAFTLTPGSPAVNSLGFKSPEFPTKAKSGTVRVALVGGSTTESYAYFLVDALKLLAAEPVDVLGFGVSGWSTAESTVNFCLNVVHYRPDAVVIHHAVNDTLPRAFAGFRTDYSHWRISPNKTLPWWQRTLARWSQLYLYFCWKRDFKDFTTATTERQGVPLDLGEDRGERKLRPETMRAYEQNLRTMITLARSIGARPFLMTMPYSLVHAKKYGVDLYVQAILEHNACMRRLATEYGCELIDLHAEIDGTDECFLDLVHLNAERVGRKAMFVANALWKAGIVTTRFAPGKRYGR